MEILGKILRNDILRNNRDFEVVLLIYIYIYNVMCCYSSKAHLVKW